MIIQLTVFLCAPPCNRVPDRETPSAEHLLRDPAIAPALLRFIGSPTIRGSGGGPPVSGRSPRCRCAHHPNRRCLSRVVRRRRSTARRSGSGTAPAPHRRER